MSKYSVYGIGAALVDTEVEVTDQFLSDADIGKGLMTLVDEARQTELLEDLEPYLVGASRASGGSAANTVIANSYFGGKSFYSCKVANDENGAFYLQDLKDAGVDHPQSTLEEGITGKCLVMITEDAERTMNTYLGISETVSENELDEAAIINSEYVYIEGYLVTSPSARAAAIKCREIAEANQVKTAISLSDPGMVEFFKDGLKQMIGKKVDLLFCNEVEALEWSGSNSINGAVKALKKIARTFAITLGSKGAIVYDGKNLIDIEPFAVTALDTNGAGDMFAGAFLYGITNGYSYTDAGRLASLAASEIVTQYGPRLPREYYPAILEKLNL